MKLLIESIGAALLLLTILIFAVCATGAVFADIPLAVPCWLFIAMFVEASALIAFGSPMELEEAY